MYPLRRALTMTLLMAFALGRSKAFPGAIKAKGSLFLPGGKNSFLRMSTTPDIIPRAAVSVVVRRAPSQPAAAATYCLVQRGKQPNKGLWSLPGGTIEVGETVLEAAQRELQEETQLDGSASLKWFLGGPITCTDSIHCGSGDQKLQWHYVIAQCFCEAPTNASLVASADASDARWMTMAQVQEKIEKEEATPGIRRVLERAENCIKLACSRAVHT